MRNEHINCQMNSSWQKILHPDTKQGRNATANNPSTVSQTFNNTEECHQTKFSPFSEHHFSKEATATTEVQELSAASYLKLCLTRKMRWIQYTWCIFVDGFKQTYYCKYRISFTHLMFYDFLKPSFNFIKFMNDNFGSSQFICREKVYFNCSSCIYQN